MMDVLSRAASLTWNPQKEFREGAPSGGSVACSSSCGSCAVVASRENFRTAAFRNARNSSLHVRNPTKVLSSGFWGVRTASWRMQRSKSLGSSQSKRSYPFVEARLFGPAIFQAAKLRVLTLGKESRKNAPENVEPPRIYTVTHSDITAQLTLAIAQEINKTQFMGWYSRLQRDEVLAEWRKTKGVLMLHVHCHVSGGNWLHYMIAKLRFFIFQKELPMVLEAILHADRELFRKHPELAEAPVYVYFHSNIEEYNRMEYWGPLSEATKRPPKMTNEDVKDQMLLDGVCLEDCECCSRHATVIPIPDSLQRFLLSRTTKQQQTQEQL